MGIQSQDNLNSLQRSLPEGLIVDAAWLERHGYSRALRKKYVTRGWLDRVVRGVYRRPAPKVQESLRWQAVVISLQTLLGRPYTVGGRTALELQGFAHSLSGHHREIHLYGTGKPPGWLSKLHLENQFVLHNVDRLFTRDSRRPRGSKSGTDTGNSFLQSSYIRNCQEWRRSMEAVGILQ